MKDSDMLAVPPTAMSPSRTRWLGLCLVFFTTFISNIDRANISVCTTTILSDLSLTPIEMGMITSAFSLAYAALQIPSALWVRKYGTRLAIAVAIFFWSLFTLTTGLATGFLFLIVSRIFFGFAEAPVHPGLNQYNMHWFPLKERAFACAIPNAGSWFALIVSPPLMVWVLELLGWRWVFYLCAVLGIVAAVLWYWLTRNSPREHPAVNQAELEYIQSNQNVVIKGGRVPWAKLFKARSFWCIGFTYFCSVYMLQYFVYWLPFYLQTQLHMNLKTMGFAASIPWIFIFVATMSVGRISDRLVRANCSLFVARNCLILLGFAGSAIAMYVSTFMTDPWTIVLLLSVALGFIGFNMAIPWAIAPDIGGEYTGIVASWMNTWGQVGAAIMATASAYIGTHYGWNNTLVALVIVACVGIMSTLAIRPDKRLV